jgi:hypothetical protein
MPAGRPRPADDPRVMASMKTALRRVARPGILELIRNWRYELGLSAGLAAVGLASGYALAAAWLITLAAAGLVLLAAGLARPPSRGRLIARAWCVVTPHRVRTGCRRARVQTTDGSPPIILYTTPAAFGERVTLWCPDGMTYGDLGAARDVLRAVCRAGNVRVLASARYPHFVVLEVIRRRTAGPRDEADPAWPHIGRDGEADGADATAEPALQGGPRHHRPFG